MLTDYTALPAHQRQWHWQNRKGWWKSNCQICWPNWQKLSEGHRIKSIINSPYTICYYYWLQSALS